MNPIRLVNLAVVGVGVLRTAGPLVAGRRGC